MTESNHNKNITDSLIATIEHLDEPWGIKDIYSRHLYMNKAAYLYTNTPRNFNIEEVPDKYFPTKWAEDYEKFVEHDSYTKKIKNRVTVIETHYWFGKTQLSPYISDKIPIFNHEENIIGIIWNAQPLKLYTATHLISQKEPTTLMTEINESHFTKAELDIIFLLCHRYNAKEIAGMYHLSVKTIENRIYAIYQKAGVHNQQQFEEFCITHQLNKYIPQRLLRKGINFIK